MATNDTKTKATTSNAANDDTTSVGEGVFETPNLAKIEEEPKIKKIDSVPAPMSEPVSDLDETEDDLLDEEEDDDSDIKAALKEIDKEMAKEKLPEVVEEDKEPPHSSFAKATEDKSLGVTETLNQENESDSDDSLDEVEKEEPVQKPIQPWKTAVMEGRETKATPEEMEEETLDEEETLEESQEEGREILEATEAEKKDFEAHKEDMGTVLQAQQHATAQQTKPKPIAKIEDVLSDGLDAYFVKMPVNKQAEFKKVGEETSAEVWKLLKSVKVKVVEILDLIRRWLGMIPGVNKFFIEQESKLKTDQLIRLKEEGQLEEDK